MKLKLKDNIFNAKIAANKKSQAIGMMGKKFNDEFNAMLFLTGGEKQSFWMKNCIIPLDIIILKNNVIINIHNNCPPCAGDNCPTYGGNGNMVLELYGGTCQKLGIEPGDVLEFLF